MLNLCGIVVAILKMATSRNFSMSGINSGHHYLPTYQILMISDNVEFLRYCGGHFENGDWQKFFNVRNQFGTSLSTHISNFRINQKHISITPSSFMKFCPVVSEICRGQVHGPRRERKENNNNNNKKRSKNNKSPKLFFGRLNNNNKI